MHQHRYLRADFVVDVDNDTNFRETLMPQVEDDGEPIINRTTSINGLENRSDVFQRDVDAQDPKKKELFEIYERNKKFLFLEKDQVSFTILCFYKKNFQKFQLK